MVGTSAPEKLFFKVGSRDTQVPLVQMVGASMTLPSYYLTVVRCRSRIIRITRARFMPFPGTAMGLTLRLVQVSKPLVFRFRTLMIEALQFGVAQSTLECMHHCHKLHKLEEEEGFYISFALISCPYF